MDFTNEMIASVILLIGNLVDLTRKLGSDQIYTFNDGLKSGYELVVKVLSIVCTVFGVLIIVNQFDEQLQTEHPYFISVILLVLVFIFYFIGLYTNQKYVVTIQSRINQEDKNLPIIIGAWFNEYGKTLWNTKKQPNESMWSFMRASCGEEITILWSPFSLTTAKVLVAIPTVLMRTAINLCLFTTIIALG
jgi:hypothetical protein